MTIAPCDTRGSVATADAAPIVPLEKRSLHRLREVRRQQQLSVRTVARRLKLTVEEVRWQEKPYNELSLTDLYRWQKALNVPVSELLVDYHLELSPPVYERARMVRVMKTVATLFESADSKGTRRLVDMLTDQLLEIMPELTNVGPWQASGSQRSLDDLGQAADRCFSPAALLEAC